MSLNAPASDSAHRYAGNANPHDPESDGYSANQAYYHPSQRPSGAFVPSHQPSHSNGHDVRRASLGNSYPSEASHMAMPKGRLTTPTTNPELYTLTARSAIPGQAAPLGGPPSFNGSFHYAQPQPPASQPSFSGPSSRPFTRDDLNLQSRMAASNLLSKVTDPSIQSAPPTSHQATSYFDGHFSPKSPMNGFSPPSYSRSLTPTHQEGAVASPLDSLDTPGSGPSKSRHPLQTVDAVVHALNAVTFEMCWLNAADCDEKIKMLDQAIWEYKEKLLAAARNGAVLNRTALRSGLTSPELQKGEKKRMLENESQQPPSKRMESAASVRQERLPIHHTHSTPLLPTQTRFASQGSMSTYINPLSPTPGTDATVAGVHMSMATPAVSPPSLNASFSSPLSATPGRPAMMGQRPDVEPLNVSAVSPEQAAGSILRSAPPTPTSTTFLTEATEAKFTLQSTPSSPQAKQALGTLPDLLPSNELLARPLPHAVSMEQMDSIAPSLTSSITMEEVLNREGDVDMMDTSTPAPARSRANTFGSSSRRSPGPMTPDDGQPPSTSIPDTIPPELKDRMDIVFVEWLEDLCNDLEAKDSKGELIHQTLMAKKMQKLDDSGEFRPFKFRIQAFTNRFGEELINRGFRESEVPHKLIRQYLWSQNLICRFNEEGKKAKSKGNHVWSIDAKRCGEGRWQFRRFERRIALPTSRIARAGSYWSWDARIWDPQVASLSANFSSPFLPDWLSWKQSKARDWVTVLSGTPPPVMPGQTNVPDVTHRIEVYADFEVNDQPQQLAMSFTLTVTANGGLVASDSSPLPPNLPFSVPGHFPMPPQPLAPLEPFIQGLPPTQQLVPPMIHGGDMPAPALGSAFIPNPPPAEPVSMTAAESASAQAISSILEPSNLLAAEQQIFPNESGPIASALANREEKVLALNAAAACLPVNEPISGQDHERLSALQEAAAHAHETATRVVQEAQNNVLNGIISGAITPAPYMPPPSA